MFSLLFIDFAYFFDKLKFFLKSELDSAALKLQINMFSLVILGTKISIYFTFIRSFLSRYFTEVYSIIWYIIHEEIELSKNLFS